MAIDFDRNTITSGYSIDKINDNFDKLETALQDGLSRSGGSPNQMEADLDMNGFSVLNVGEISIDGTSIQDLVQEATDAAELAEKWATNPEDVPVEPGKFSALHWAEKAFDNHTAGVAGVSSFNGRTLAVVPAVNDYTSAQVQHGAGSVSDALALKADTSALALKADNSAVAASLSLKLDKAGDVMSGDLNMGGNDITNVATINGGPVGGSASNYAENGNFELAVNTKNAPGTINLKFATDRWVSRWQGSTSVHTQQAFALGAGLVPNAVNYVRTVVTSVAGASNFSELDHPLEGVTRLAGKQLTVTFWAKADAAKNITFFTTQYFGAGGSANVHANQTVVALTTSWAKYSFVVNIGSLAGKTVGTDKRECTLFRWVYDIGTTAAAPYGITPFQQSGTFEMAHVSIVEGNATAIADPFQIQHIVDVVDICSRYYETGRHLWSGDVITGQQYFFYIPYKSLKVNVDTPGFTVNYTLTGLNHTSVSQSDRGMIITMTANLTGRAVADYTWTADYEL